MSALGSRPEKADCKLPVGEFHFYNSPTHPRTIALYECWRSKCTADDIPRRNAIDPVEIPNLLPNISIVDIERSAGLRFKIRLFGTALSDLVGEDRTGFYMEDIGDGMISSARAEAIRRWQTTCRRAHDEREPVFSIGTRSDPYRNHHIIHTCALPLADKAGKLVTQIIGLIEVETKASDPTGLLQSLPS